MSSPETAPITSRQLDRGDCRIGDWVKVSDIPEWINTTGPHRFTPPSVVISPEAGVLGGVVPAQHPEQWLFALVEQDGALVWKREN